jgi:BirA family biotin operon repressor/biotin-[acetyl-CoA-carboxylase] ligase
MDDSRAPLTMVSPHQHPLPPDIAEALAAAAERLGGWPTALHWYVEIASTNTTAASLAEDGALEGVVVGAEAQREGRGRLGRSWFSPPGAGLYLSIVLRPRETFSRLVTVTAGLGVAEGIERATGLEVRLKWPNDLYVEGRKAGGILTEAGTSRDGRPYAVVGVGVNVASMTFPREVASRATSLEAELGRPVDRGLVMAESLVGLAARYGQLRRGEQARVMEAWRTRAAFIVGRPIEWDADGGTGRGIVEAVDDDATLVVRTEAGSVRLISGEVRWT